MMSQTEQLIFRICLQDMSEPIYLLFNMAIWPFPDVEQTGKDEQPRASRLKEGNVLSWFGPDNIHYFTHVDANMCGITSDQISKLSPEKPPWTSQGDIWTMRFRQQPLFQPCGKRVNTKQQQLISY